MAAAKQLVNLTLFPFKRFHRSCNFVSLFRTGGSSNFAYFYKICVLYENVICYKKACYMEYKKFRAIDNLNAHTYPRKTICIADSLCSEHSHKIHLHLRRSHTYICIPDCHSHFLRSHLFQKQTLMTSFDMRWHSHQSNSSFLHLFPFLCIQYVLLPYSILNMTVYHNNTIGYYLKIAHLNLFHCTIDR